MVQSGPQISHIFKVSGLPIFRVISASMMYMYKLQFYIDIIPLLYQYIVHHQSYDSSFIENSLMMNVAVSVSAISASFCMTACSALAMFTRCGIAPCCTTFLITSGDRECFTIHATKRLASPRNRRKKSLY